MAWREWDFAAWGDTVIPLLGQESKGDTVSGTWGEDYRIRYYLSSEKLKTVN